MDWKIYYADETTFSSGDGTWEEAPLDEVVCIIMRSAETGRQIWCDEEYYYNMPGGAPNEIYGSDDMMQQLRRRARWLKYGVCLPKEKYNDIIKRASREDADLPLKR